MPENYLTFFFIDVIATIMVGDKHVLSMKQRINLPKVSCALDQITWEFKEQPYGRLFYVSFRRHVK